jgi:hypothetical protein
MQKADNFNRLAGANTLAYSPGTSAMKKKACGSVS